MIWNLCHSCQRVKTVAADVSNCAMTNAKRSILLFKIVASNSPKLYFYRRFEHSFLVESNCDVLQCTCQVFCAFLQRSSDLDIRHVNISFVKAVIWCTIIFSNKDFCSSWSRPMMIQHASESSVEDRIKRNIHKLQRTNAALDKNFSKH